MSATLTGTERDGAHILTPDGLSTWSYDPAWFRHKIDQLRLTNREVEDRLGVSSGYLGRLLRERAHVSAVRRAADGTEKRYVSRGGPLSYDQAVKLAIALDIDPREAGV